MFKLFNLIIEILSIPFKIIGIPLKIIDLILKIAALLVLAATVYLLNLIPAYTDFVNTNIPFLGLMSNNLKKLLGLVNKDDIKKASDAFQSLTK